MAYRCSAVPPTPPIVSDFIGEWITLSVHTEDENDQIIIEPFHVYICGPSPPGTPNSMPEQNAIPPASSSSYSDSIPTVIEIPASVPVTVPHPKPRNPPVVTAGLSTRSADISVIAPPDTAWGVGTLTQHKRLHLQFWLNGCRRCATSGIHRAVFNRPQRPYASQGTTYNGTEAQLELNATPVRATLRSPVSGASSRPDSSSRSVPAPTIGRRRAATLSEAAAHVGSYPTDARASSNAAEIDRVYPPFDCSPSAEGDEHVHVDTPWATGTTFHRSSAFTPSLSGIEDTGSPARQPEPEPPAASGIARTGGYGPVVKLEPAPRGRSRRRKDNVRDNRKGEFETV